MLVKFPKKKFSSKILRFLWDEFGVKEIYKTAKSLPASKKQILKILSMFYDPLVLIQTQTASLKLLFQDICKLKIP